MLMVVTAVPVTSAVNNTQLQVSASGFIGIKIVAKVNSVDDPNNLLGDVIQVNDTITGKYVYDPGIPDSDPDTTRGHYPFTSSACKFEVFADGLTFKNNPSNMDFGIWIYNNHFGNTDEYSVLSLNNLQLDNGMLVTTIQWDIMDLNGTALDSDALPTTAPVLTEWELNSLILIGTDPADPTKTYGITAQVTKVTKNIAIDVEGVERNWATPTFLSSRIPSSFQVFWERMFQRFPQVFPILRQLLAY